MTSVQSSEAASQRLTTTSSPWVWILPPSDVWTCDGACVAGSLREGLQERIDGYKKKKRIVNKQSDDQATENESRSNVTSKYSTLMSSFEPSSSLGWSQTNCSWMFFFPRNTIFTSTLLTNGLAFGWNFKICEFNSTSSNLLIARVQLWS